MFPVLLPLLLDPSSHRNPVVNPVVLSLRSLHHSRERTLLSVYPFDSEPRLPPRPGPGGRPGSSTTVRRRRTHSVLPQCLRAFVAVVV